MLVETKLEHILTNSYKSDMILYMKSHPNAFKLMIKIIKKHPDLSNENSFLTVSQYTDSLSDTVKKSIQKMVVGLKL